MKASIVLVLVAILAIKVTSAAYWTAYSSCSKPCDIGVQSRECISTDGTLCDTSSGQVAGGYVDTQLCNTQACVNCTVSGWSRYGGCTKTCGGGTYWRSRTVTKYPSDGLGGVGGTPCPILNQTLPCNTQLCYTTLKGMGYVYWGPLKGPGPLTYQVVRGNTEVDVFLFKQADFFQYQYDATRTTPYETGYTAVRSALNVENSGDVIPLDTTSSYFLVVDHTLIGAAQGTTQNGQQVFNANLFYFSISGLVVPTPMYIYPDGYSAATSTHAPSFTLLVTMIGAAIVALLR